MKNSLSSSFAIVYDQPKGVIKTQFSGDLSYHQKQVTQKHGLFLGRIHEPGDGLFWYYQQMRRSLRLDIFNYNG